MKLKNFPKLNLTMGQSKVGTGHLDEQLFMENDFGSQLQENLDPDLLQILENDFNLDET